MKHADKLIVPRVTSYTATRAISRYPDLFDPHEGKAEISVVFTYDVDRAEDMADAWRDWGWQITLGGPAYDDPGGEFVPGKYTKEGIVITHRGCIRNCPFCYVPKREGKIRELEVKAGNILNDNNILACSETHQRKVFAMLRGQKSVSLRGGLDSRLLKDWHIEEIRSLKLEDIWLAYDNEKDMATFEAITKFRNAGLTHRKGRCYVLVGYDNDTLEKADERCRAGYRQGAYPFAQLYDGYNKDDKYLWKRLARNWSRPAVYKAREK